MDPELPAGFQDADFEYNGILATAKREQVLARKKICSHGWLQGPPGPPGKPTNVVTCHYCGKVFADFDEAYTERAELLS